jgi:hypothetical protein
MEVDKSEVKKSKIGKEQNENQKVLLQSLNKMVKNFKDRYPLNFKLEFSERNTIVDNEKEEDIPLENDLNINADIIKEVNFYNKTLANTKKALLKLKEEGVKIFRPKDFYAEMFKSDEQMEKVKVVLERKKGKIQEVEKKKEVRMNKRFQKQMKHQKNLEVAVRKKQGMKDIEKWKKNLKNDNNARLEDSGKDVKSRNRKISKKGGKKGNNNKRSKARKGGRRK